MLNKIVKNIRWRRACSQMKSCGINCKVGLDFSVSGKEFISIGDNFRGGKHIILDAINQYNGEATSYVPKLVIGNNVTLTNNCYISCINEIVIEDGCLFGANSFVCDNSHGNVSLEESNITPSQRKLYSKNPIHIGKNVWVGKNVCILAGVTIGDGAVIGANAVVTHDVPANTVVAGIPARVIKEIM